jgi:hypothetical protein
MGPLSLRPFCLGCIIATRGYDFWEGQGSFKFFHVANRHLIASLGWHACHRFQCIKVASTSPRACAFKQSCFQPSPTGFSRARPMTAPSHPAASFGLSAIRAPSRSECRRGSSRLRFPELRYTYSQNSAFPSQNGGQLLEGSLRISYPQPVILDLSTGLSTNLRDVSAAGSCPIGRKLVA